MGRTRLWLGILAAAMMLLADGSAVAAQGRGRGHKAFRIPPGHMPPPGECRVWYPGVPPGHQPPAVPCRALHGGYFPGAVIVSTPLYRDGRRERVRDDVRFRRDRRRYDSARRVDVWEPSRVGRDGWVELRLVLGF